MVKIVMDMDVGVDDGMAIAYAAASRDIQLLGIVGTYGNIDAQASARNARKLLDLCGAGEVPVYQGLSNARAKEAYTRLEVSARIHGENGVGNIELEDGTASIMPGSGIDFLIDCVETYKEELVIVTTGPLTDLAAVLDRMPDAASKIKRVVVMGGALTVSGNIRKIAEANISQDPEAARLVFESGIHVDMVGLDVTMRSLLTKAQTGAWREIGSDAGRKYADMVDYYIDHVKAKGGCFMHDPSAVAMAAHPEWFTALPFYLTVVEEGDQRGRTVVDTEKLQENHPNVSVCLQVDTKSFLEDFQGSLLRLFTR